MEDTASRTEIESAPLPNTEVSSTAQDTTSTAIIADDPTQWPAVLTDSVHCQIVKKGPVQVTNIVFPQNSKYLHVHFAWGPQIPSNGPGCVG